MSLTSSDLVGERDGVPQLTKEQLSAFVANYDDAHQAYPKFVKYVLAYYKEKGVKYITCPLGYTSLSVYPAVVDAFDFIKTYYHGKSKPQKGKMTKTLDLEQESEMMTKKQESEKQELEKQESEKQELEMMTKKQELAKQELAKQELEKQESEMMTKKQKPEEMTKKQKPEMMTKNNAFTAFYDLRGGKKFQNTKKRRPRLRSRKFNK